MTPVLIQQVCKGRGNYMLVVDAGDVLAHFHLIESMKPADVELLLKDPRLSRILIRWAQSPRSAVISLVTYLSETAGLIAQLCIDVERKGLGRPASADEACRVVRAVAKAGVSLVDKQAARTNDVTTPITFGCVLTPCDA